MKNKNEKFEVSQSLQNSIFELRNSMKDGMLKSLQQLEKKIDDYERCFVQLDWTFFLKKTIRHVLG